MNMLDNKHCLLTFDFKVAVKTTTPCRSLSCAHAQKCGAGTLIRMYLCVKWRCEELVPNPVVSPVKRHAVPGAAYHPQTQVGIKVPQKVR